MRSYGCVRVSLPLRPDDRVGHAATCQTTISDVFGQSLRAREGECELGTLAIGKRCQERISATGWAWLRTVRGIRSRHALCGAQPGLMVRGSPAATGYRPTRQTRGLYKGG